MTEIYYCAKHQSTACLPTFRHAEPQPVKGNPKPIRIQPSNSFCQTADFFFSFVICVLMMVVYHGFHYSNSIVNKRVFPNCTWMKKSRPCPEEIDFEIQIRNLKKKLFRMIQQRLHWPNWLSLLYLLNSPSFALEPLAPLCPKTAYFH